MISQNGIKLGKFLSLNLHIFKRITSLIRDVEAEKIKVVVHTKDFNEKFTNIDWLIQKIYVNYLNIYFPNLKFVGEEDISKAIEIDEKLYEVNKEENINFDFLNEDDFASSINPDELTIFMDPIDSTSSFIKRKFDPVTSLVGVAYKEKPYIGFIHFPLYQGKMEESVTFFNIPGKGVFKFNVDTNELSKIENNKNEDLTFVCSSSRTNPEMDKIVGLFENSKKAQESGLGNKSVSCILNDYVYLASGAGLGLWDVCCGNALCKELGGGLYYLNGEEIKYSADPKDRHLSKFVILTKNADKAKNFIEIYSKSGLNVDKYS